MTQTKLQRRFHFRASAAIRVILGCVLALAAWFFEQSLLLRFSLGMVGVALVWFVAIGLFRQRYEKHAYLPLFSVLIDTTALSVWIMFTGGSASPFLLSFVVATALASARRSRGPGWISVAAALVFGGLASLAVALEWVKTENILTSDPTPPTLLATGVHMFTLAFALVSTHLVVHSRSARSGLLHDEAERLRTDSEELARLMQRINERRDLDGMVGDIHAFLAARFPISDLILLTLDRLQNQLIPASFCFTCAPADARNVVRRLAVPLDESGGILARVFRRRRAFLMRNTAATLDIFRKPYPGIETDREVVRRLELSSFLLVPLVMQDESIGLLLCTDYRSPLKIPPADVAALEQIAHQIAPALHTNLLLENLRSERRKVREARAEIEYINLVSRRISEAGDFKAALEIVRAHLSERFGIREFVLYRMSPGRHLLEPLRESLESSLSENTREQLLRHSIPAGPTASIHGRVCALRKPKFFRVIRAGSLMDETEKEVMDVLGMKSVLIVPLIRENEVIGVFDCTNGPEAMELTPSDVHSVALFCDQVAGLLSTFASLEEARAAREKSDAMRGDLVRLQVFARDLNTLTTRRQVVDAVYDYAHGLFPHSTTWLVRADEEAGFFVFEPPAPSFSGRAPTLPFDTIPIDREAGMLFQVWRRRRFVQLTDLGRVERLMSDFDRRSVEMSGLRDVAYCPLILENRVVGMLGLGGLGAALRDTTRIHLHAFCEQAAGAMQRTLLTEQSERSRHRMASIGSMAAGIIHDLKNPMTTIKGYAEMSDSNIGMERRREYLERIGREADRLTEMCWEILEFAGGVNAAECDPQQLVAEVLSFKEEDLRKRGIRAEVEFETGLRVQLDRERMRRTLLNLVTNAIEAMHSVSAERRQLLVFGTCDHGTLVLRIRDGGPGIPEDVRARLFESFATSGKAHGTGLGLSIAKSIIDAHNGTITFRTSDAGTEFMIRLPGCTSSEGPVRARRSGERRQGFERRSGDDRREEGGDTAADGRLSSEPMPEPSSVGVAEGRE